MPKKANDNMDEPVMDKFSIDIKYKGTGGDKSISLSAILNIDENNLTEHYAEQAAIFGYFAVQLAEADRLVNIAKMATEQEYSMVDEEWRDEFREEGTKFTEAVIRGKVVLDEDYQKLLSQQHDMEHNVAIIKAIINALKMRADMLISMGAHMRQEYDMTGMVVREKRMDDAIDNAKSKIRRKKESEQV